MHDRCNYFVPTSNITMFLLSKVIGILVTPNDCFKNIRAEVAHEHLFFYINVLFDRGEQLDCPMLLDSQINVSITLRSSIPHIVSLYYSGVASYN